MPTHYNQSINAVVYEIGNYHFTLSGVETDTDPAPDISEIDKLYENFIVNEIPDTIPVEKPFVGFANAEGNIYTLGGSCLMQCSYINTDSGFPFSIVYPDFYVWISGLMPIHNIQYKDGLIFIHGFNYLSIFDYNTHMQNQIFVQNTIFSIKSKDAVSIKHPANGIVYISQNGYDNYELQLDGWIVDEYYNHFNYINGHITDATSLINVNDNVLTLSNQSITLYSLYLHDFGYWGLKVEKQYPFGGTSMLKDGNRLIVAGPQGLKFYDISNLNNIVLIP